MIKKIFVIEGADGVGKETQSNLLLTKLRLLFSELEKNIAIIKVSFPNYESDSSYFVRKFLSGEFPENSIRNDAYAVSTAYALDRYLTWNSEIQNETWEDFSKFYNIDPSLKITYNDLYRCPDSYGFSGIVIIADRYIQSNWMYQCARIILENNKWFSDLDKEEENDLIENFIKWSSDLENMKFGVPGRALGTYVFYLSLSEEIAKRNRMKRNSAMKSSEDILEKSESLQIKVREIAETLCDKKYMDKIICYDNSLMLSETEIHNILMNKVQNILFPSEKKS